MYAVVCVCACLLIYAVVCVCAPATYDATYDAPLFVVPSLASSIYVPADNLLNLSMPAFFWIYGGTSVNSSAIPLPPNYFSPASC